MENCIFCKIKDGIIPKEFTYQDGDIMVFPDIHPVRPVHLLIIPKRHIEDFLEFNNQVLFLKLKAIIDKMVKENGLDQKGYRIGINGGGAQIIRHLHIHLIGPMGKNDEI
jgi:histidine triad (HIT) family protein